jgi:cytochrome c-type biogenesis protein CcmF
MDGAGLNPLLQTFWMFIHPPIVFAGYTFVIFAFTLTLAGMNKRRVGSESRFLRLCLLFAWLLLTVGIAVGGLWAYEVLGWGGYWAWDPVETASLLPWLTLTSLFHLGPSAKLRKNLTKELMITLTFAATIFTTAITRGGLLVSVHAFGLSPVGPLLILYILAFVVYFFYLAKKSKKPLFTLEIDTSSPYSIFLNISYWSLIFITLICFWGVFFPLITGIFQSNSLSTTMDFYNNWNFPFVLAFVAALIGCNVHNKIGMKKYTVLIIGAVGVGIISALFGWPTPNFLANLGLPLVFVALLTIGYIFFSHLAKKKRAYRLVGRTILHLGITFILLGVLVSSTSKEATSELTQPNTTINAIDLSIEVNNPIVYTGIGNVHLTDRCYYEHSSMKVDATITQGSESYSGSLWIHLYTAYGLVSNPLIIHTWEGDLYLHLRYTNSTYYSLVHALMDLEELPEDLMISVERIPFVHFVWIGVAMLAVGESIALTGELAKTLSGSRRVSKKTPKTKK